MRSGGSFIKDEKSGKIKKVEGTKQPQRSGPRNDKGELLDERGEPRASCTKKSDSPKPGKNDDQGDGNKQEVKKS
tara:strand:- start:631 stop:855 length:225 start_codon:yes stop_codon:yes gene_type:complete